MLNIAICDDEQEFKDIVKDKVTGYFAKRNKEIKTSVFSSSEELLECNDIFDIILLDVQLNGMSGMDAAQIIRKKNENTVIIFISAFVEYSPIGYKFNATRYLLKKDIETGFEESMNAAIKIISDRNETIRLSYKQSVFNVPVEQIMYIISVGRTLEFYTVDRIEPLICYEKIDSTESFLEEKGFIRCHQSYLVNYKYVSVFKAKVIVMQNGTEIPISKARREEAKQKYILMLG